MTLLGRIGPNPQPLSALFTIQTEAPPRELAPLPPGAARPRLNAPFVSALALLTAAALLSGMVQGRHELAPAHKPLVAFPMHLGDWQGQQDRLEKYYVDALKFDDYLLADYVGPKHQQINLYIAYYASQRKGQSAHSPRTCIPGGGWDISSLSTVTIPPATASDRPLRINRLLIQRDRDRQLVYYWFKERDRLLTNEYAVKGFLFWDALTRNRTDGALIRLTSHIDPTENIEAVDHRLTEFARSVADNIQPFIPD
jgi:EpsI family protein